MSPCIKRRRTGIVLEYLDPVGRRFPSVTGNALSRAAVRLPEDLSGAPAVLLAAYRRGTQTDIDRWRVFLEREAPGLAVYELPVIPSFAWRPLAGVIDDGMRGGVPRALWGNVITLYREGGVVRDFLGDRGGYRAHVALLDAHGVVRWFGAGGFHSAAAGALLAALRGLETGPAEAGGAPRPTP